MVNGVPLLSPIFSARITSSMRIFIRCSPWVEDLLKVFYDVSTMYSIKGLGHIHQQNLCGIVIGGDADGLLCQYLESEDLLCCSSFWHVNGLCDWDISVDFMTNPPD